MASLQKETFSVPKNPVSLFGETGYVHPVNQTGRLYSAEKSWRDSNIDALQTISLNGARDLVHEIIHNNKNDEVPGIDRVRREFDPNAIRFEHIGMRLPEPMEGATTPQGHILLRKRSMNTGIITHEASHLMNRLGHQFSGYGENITGDSGFGHQWPFARTHLWVIHHNIGEDAAKALYEHYRRLGVAVSPGKSLRVEQ